jgi:hypothetical protein
VFQTTDSPPESEFWVPVKEYVQSLHLPFFLNTIGLYSFTEQLDVHWDSSVTRRALKSPVQES